MDALPRGDRDRLTELAQLVVREPGSIPRRLDLATALLDAGRRREAIGLLRDVALSYAEDGHLIQAMAICRGILEIDPKHEETVALLAAFVERRGGRPVSHFATTEELSPPPTPPAAAPPARDGFAAEEDTQAGDSPVAWGGAPRVATPVEDDDEEEQTSPGARLALADLEGTEQGDASADPVAEALLLSATREEVTPVDLPAFPLFSELPRAAFVELLHDVTIVARGPGEVLVAEGTAGDAFYLIAEGTVRVRKGDVELALLGPGSFFGEFAVLADQRRHATVESTTAVRLVEVTRALLDRLIADHPGVARILRAFYGDRLLATLLQTAPFFAELSPEERAEVATRFRPRRFGRGATIIEEGAAGGGLYLILVGEVEVVRNDGTGTIELGRLGEGSYFGEMSLLKGANASATVRASRLCETVQLPPRDFYEIVSRHPVLWEQLRTEAEQRELTNVAILAGEARGDEDAQVYLV